MNLACPSAHSGQLSKPPAIWKIKDFENIEHKNLYLLDEWLKMVYSTLMVKNVSSLAEILTRTFSNFIFGSTWSGRSGWLWCWASDCLVFVECRYYRVFRNFIFGLTPLCSIGWPCGGECVSSLELYNRSRTWHKPPPHGQQTSKPYLQRHHWRKKIGDPSL